MEDFRRFRLESGDGDAEFIVHHVFEGIELTFNAVHMPACALGASHPFPVLFPKDGEKREQKGVIA